MQTVRDLTHGELADVVFEYTGSPDGVRNNLQAMVAGALGDVRRCATPGQPMEFDFGAWRKSRPTIYNIHGRRLWDTWEVAAPCLRKPHRPAADRQPRDPAGGQPARLRTDSGRRSHQAPDPVRVKRWTPKPLCALSAYKPLHRM